MSIEPGLIDANVLVYAFNFDVPQYSPSRALLEAALRPDVRLYVTSQILCEFYSVITTPKRVDNVWSSGEAVQVIEHLLALPGLQVLATPAQAVTGLLSLLQRHPVTGSNIFDLQIIAAMQANNIQRIYTFNARDFKVFPELTVVTP